MYVISEAYKVCIYRIGHFNISLQIFPALFTKKCFIQKLFAPQWLAPFSRNLLIVTFFKWKSMFSLNERINLNFFVALVETNPTCLGFS